MVLVRYPGASSQYLEDFTRDCLGVWTDNKLSGNTPQHVVAGKEGPNQGVATTELLHHNTGYTDGGLGVT